MKPETPPQKRAAAAGAFLFLACAAFSFPAAADSPSGIALTAEVRAQGIDVDNASLGTPASGNVGTGALEARLKLLAPLGTNVRFLWEGRGVASTGRGGVESADTGAVSGGESFLEWRQSYIQVDNLNGAPLSFRGGRQKIREPYGLWWNQNLDAARLTYDTTLFTGSLAVGENLGSYRTGGAGFAKNEDNIARMLAEGSWQYYYEHFIEARLLFEDDHSGVSAGDIENADDLDDGRGRLLWAGLRMAGKSRFLAAGDRKTAYRADFMAVGGSEDLAATAPLGAQRIVTAVAGQNVRGWGFDAAVDVPVPDSRPVIHLGYAYGSGDGNAADGTDHAFRQSGLSGNFSRIGALSENTDNYGTVLRPQLSNIHILSAGMTMPLLEASDIGAIYRCYRLAAPATSLRSGAVFNTLNGADRGLGQELDFLFNMDILKETHSSPARIHDLALRSSLGFFRAGEAYGAADGEVAARGLVEIKAGF